VNFFSLLIDTILLDEVKPQTVEMMFNLCSRQRQRVQELMSYFSTTPSDFSQSIYGWLDIVNIYYRGAIGYSVFCLNKYMEDKILDKKKGYEQMVFENNLLAHEILDCKDTLMAATKKYQQDTQLVLITQHGLSMYNEKMERRLKECITKYEGIKTSLDPKSYAGITLDSILSTSFILPDGDKFEEQLMKEAGLRQNE